MAILKRMLNPNLSLRLVFLITFAGFAGSLYFSEVLSFPPCTLCWYQRICMYPILVIAMVGLWREDNGCWRYILPLAAIGFAIAVYHNLIYYGVIPEALAPCQKGVSCSTRQVEYLGFVTIPLMSVLGLGLITVLSAIHWRAPEGNYEKQ